MQSLELGRDEKQIFDNVLCMGFCGKVDSGDPAVIRKMVCSMFGREDHEPELRTDLSRAYNNCLSDLCNVNKDTYYTLCFGWSKNDLQKFFCSEEARKMVKGEYTLLPSVVSVVQPEPQVEDDDYEDEIYDDDDEDEDDSDLDYDDDEFNDDLEDDDDFDDEAFDDEAFDDEEDDEDDDLDEDDE